MFSTEELELILLMTRSHAGAAVSALREKVTSKLAEPESDKEPGPKPKPEPGPGPDAAVWGS